MDEFLEVLAEQAVPDDYDDLTRYQDFRKVFLENEQGRRVLKQILSWGSLLKAHPMGVPIDPYRTERLEGQRNLALKIFAIMLMEPKERPKTQTRTSRQE